MGGAGGGGVDGGVGCEADAGERGRVEPRDDSEEDDKQGEAKGKKTHRTLGSGGFPASLWV